MLDPIRLSLEYPKVDLYKCPGAFKHQELCERVSRCREELKAIGSNFKNRILIGLVIPIVGTVLLSKLIVIVGVVFFAVIILPVTYQRFSKASELKKCELNAFNETLAISKEIEEKIRELPTILENLTEKKLFAWIDSCRFIHAYTALKDAQPEESLPYGKITPEYLAFLSMRFEYALFPVFFMTISILYERLKSGKVTEDNFIRFKNAIDEPLNKLLSVYDCLKKPQISFADLKKHTISMEIISNLIKNGRYAINQDFIEICNIRKNND